MLTGIVVSVSTTAVALALVIKIYKAYGTIEEDQIIAERRKTLRRRSTDSALSRKGN
jgi:multicomponent Na+:H+ antiporter subunit C